MITKKHKPPYPLNKYIDNILYIEGNNKGIGFPKTAMSIVFNLEDNFKLFDNNGFSDFTDYKKYWLAGFQTSPSYVESYGTSKMLVIQFKTLGAFMFLDYSMQNFKDHYIELDSIFKQEAEETWDQLCNSKTLLEKLKITENFLSLRLSNNTTPKYQLLFEISSNISRSPTTTISEICSEYNISRKHLNNLFKEKVGLSPKVLSSIFRIHKALEIINLQSPESLTHLAYDLGYFDQAHFSKDFKKFTGLSPLEYFNQTKLHPSLKKVPYFIPFSS